LIEFSAATKDLVRQVAVEKENDAATLLKHEGKNNHLGVYNFSGIVLRRVALGVIASTQTNILVRKDEDNAGLNMVDASMVAHQGATFSVAEGFFSNTLMLGTTAKYLRRQAGKISASLAEAQDIGDQVDDEENLTSTQGGGADLGLMYVFKFRSPLSLGLTIENVGGTKLAPAEAGGSSVVLPQTINVGFAVQPGTKYSTFKLLVDYRDVTGALKQTTFQRLHLGGEIAVGKLLGVTGGLNQGYPTMGAYLNMYFLRIDLGVYTQEIGSRAGARADRRFYVKLFTGF
jgi:hypothetical protein